MHIEKYKISDFTQLKKLFYDTVHSINIKDYTENQVNAWAPKDLCDIDFLQSLLKNYCIVVKEGFKILGFGDIEKSGYFNRLYVHKNYQGCGVATLITDHLENYAKSIGTKIISVNSSITAKPFFEKRGYIVIKEQSVFKRGEFFINYNMQKHF